MIDSLPIIMLASVGHAGGQPDNNSEAVAATDNNGETVAATADDGCGRQECQDTDYNYNLNFNGNFNFNINGRQDMRVIKRIFVHCTASRADITEAQLRQVFRSKGWRNPGYHYVVFADGTVVCMLGEEQVSNGVKGYNQTAVNVAYTGGIDRNGRPLDTRTAAQRASLLRLLTALKRKYPAARIMGHRDIWSETDSTKWHKACPCFNASKEYANVR